MFRVFDAKQNVKISSIIDDFSGLVKSFDFLIIKRAIKDLLGNSRLKLHKQTLIKMETASPNGTKSAWGSSVDSLAFIFYPKTLFAYIRYQ